MRFLRRNSEETAATVGLVGLVSSVMTGIQAKAGGWFGQYCIIYYIAGLLIVLMVVLVDWCIKRRRRGSLTVKLALVPLGALVWWMVLSGALQDWLREPMQPWPDELEKQ